MAADPSFQNYTNERFDMVFKMMGEVQKQAVLGCRNQVAFVVKEVQLLKG